MMMTQVVCRIRQSMGSVYKAMSAEIGVSKTAVYDKLNRLEPTEVFHCEIKTLGYPRAALFSFCMALVAYNLFSTLKGVLASVHGSDCREELSYYYLGEELEATYQGMMIALAPENWSDLGTMSLSQFSSLLQDWGQSVNLKAFSSTKRKPKKKKLKPPYDPSHPHVSTARLLAEKKKSRASPNK